MNSSEKSFLENRIQKIESEAPNLKHNKEYQSLKKNIFPSSALTRAKNTITGIDSNLKKYIVFVAKHATSYVRYYLYEICEYFDLDLNIQGVYPHLQLDIACEFKCQKSQSNVNENNKSKNTDNKWKNSMFCQICQDTPIAKFIEAIEISSTNNVENYKDYFFAKIMYTIVFALGKIVYDKFKSLQQKDFDTTCDNCLNISRYVDTTFPDASTKDKHIYKIGFRVCYVLQKQSLIHFDTLDVFLRFVYLVQNKTTLGWKEINEFIALINDLPLFLKSAVNQSVLKPQGIQLLQMKENEEQNSKWQNLLTQYIASKLH